MNIGAMLQPALQLRSNPQSWVTWIQESCNGGTTMWKLILAIVCSLMWLLIVGGTSQAKGRSGGGGRSFHQSGRTPVQHQMPVQNHTPLQHHNHHPKHHHKNKPSIDVDADVDG